MLVTYPTETLLEAVMSGYWFENQLQRNNRLSREAAAAKLVRDLEDVEWMAAGGEVTDGAAERLGLQAQSLLKRLKDAGRVDLWEKLRRNEVARFGETLAERRRREAEQCRKRWGDVA